MKNKNKDDFFRGAKLIELHPERCQGKKHKFKRLAYGFDHERDEIFDIEVCQRCHYSPQLS